jgi:hypothetical protein
LTVTPASGASCGWKSGRLRAKRAQAIALAIDGAIVRAQFDETPDVALDALKRIVKSLLKE